MSGMELDEAVRIVREWVGGNPKVGSALETVLAALEERDAKVEAFSLVKHLREQLLITGKQRDEARAEVERLTDACAGIIAQVEDQRRRAEKAAAALAAERAARERSKADALIAAAAPDLYDAAVWVLHNAHGISRSGEDGVSAEEERESWDALMAATRKAEGR